MLQIPCRQAVPHSRRRGRGCQCGGCTDPSADGVPGRVLRVQVTHTLTSVVRPICCLMINMINMLTQYPLRPFQATTPSGPARTEQWSRVGVEGAPHPTPHTHTHTTTPPTVNMAYQPSNIFTLLLWYSVQWPGFNCGVCHTPYNDGKCGETVQIDTAISCLALQIPPFAREQERLLGIFHGRGRPAQWLGGNRPKGMRARVPFDFSPSRLFCHRARGVYPLGTQALD